MYYFSELSKQRLGSCDRDLQRVFEEVIKRYDCSVVCGFRSASKQRIAYDTGRSKVQFPDSKHNNYPSRAVDVVPYPVDWDDLGAFYMFAGYVLRVAEEMNISIRYGGDWDGDRKTADQRFNDLGHFELIE